MSALSTVSWFVRTRLVLRECKLLGAARVVLCDLRIDQLRIGRTDSASCVATSDSGVDERLVIRGDGVIEVA